MRISAAVALAFLALSSPALAFGPMEHKAIATAAEYRLSARSLLALRQLLGPAGHLERVAVCADELLYAKGDYDCGGLFKVEADPSKATQPWHYINIPVGAPAPAGSLDGYCPNGKDCVVEQIRLQAAVLGDVSASVQARRVALMWLVHLVADEHQPLHCADDGDRGGNKKPVSFRGRATNLHALWDHAIMPEDWKEQAELEPGELVNRLAKGLEQGAPRAWLRGDYVAGAALESFGVAQDVVYPAYRAGEGRDLGEAYQRRMQPLEEARMEGAVVRLAELLDLALGKDPLFPDARLLKAARSDADSR